MKVRNHTRRDYMPEVRSITISNSEILALPTVPIEIVPGVPGMLLKYISGTVFKYLLTAAYTGIADNDAVFINYDGQGANFGDVDAGFFDFAGGGDNSLTNLLGNTPSILFNDPPASNVISGSYNRPTGVSGPATVIGKGLMLAASVAGGNFGGGSDNNQFAITIVYYKLKVD